MTIKLRGITDGLVSRVPKADKKYGLRDDASPKGLGWFGEIYHLDDPGSYATELSIMVGTLCIPLLVPTLTLMEIAHLVDGGGPTVSIFEKALDHAKIRIACNLSPFATPGEQVPLPKES